MAENDYSQNPYGPDSSQQDQYQQNQYQQEPYGQNPYQQEPYGQNQYQQEPYGQNPYQQEPYGQNPYQQESYGQNPYQQEPYGQNQYQQNPYQQNPYEPDPYGPDPNGPGPNGPDLYGPGPYDQGPYPSGRPPKNKKKLWQLLILVIAAAVALIVVFAVVVPTMQYNAKKDKFEKAAALMQEEQYTDAEKIFLELEDFEGAADKAQECAALQETLNKYNAAVQKFESGKYADAKKELESLGTYKDSKSLAETCGKYLDYDAAKNAMDSGDYEGALQIFERLGDFEDAKKLAGECQDMIEKKAAYEEAQAAFGRGDYEAAQPLFEKLGDFEDAKEMAEKCAFMTAYKAGEKLYSDGSYKKAKEAWEALPETYPDALDWLWEIENVSLAAKIDSCDVLIAFKEAKDLFNNGDLEKAKKALEKLDDKGEELGVAKNQERANMEYYIEAMALYEKGDYYEAYEKFTWSGLKDSEAMAQKCIQPIPGTGETYRNPNYAGANCSLSIYPPTDDGNHNYIKLYNTANELVSSIFIRSGESGYLELPGGAYIFKVAYGSGDWFGEKDMFGDEGNYYVMEMNGGNVVNMEAGYDWELTLRTSKTEGQSMGEESVDRDSF